MALPSQPVSDADNAACAIASGASTVCHRRPGAVALSSVPRPHASSGGLPGRPTWAAYLGRRSRCCPSRCCRPPGRRRSAACAAGSACGTPRRPAPPCGRSASPGSAGREAAVSGLGPRTRRGRGLQPKLCPRGELSFTPGRLPVTKEKWPPGAAGFPALCTPAEPSEAGAAGASVLSWRCRAGKATMASQPRIQERGAGARGALSPGLLPLDFPALKCEKQALSPN